MSAECVWTVSRGRESSLAEHEITDSFSSRKGIVSETPIADTTQSNSSRNSEPATFLTKRIVPIVDASNVARIGAEKAKLDRLVSLLNRFKQLALKPICIADANLWRLIDYAESFEKMVHSETVLQAPAGSSADTFIVATAEHLSRKGALPYLVTNDKKLAESAAPAPSVKFLFVPWEKEEFVLFDPALEKLSQGVGR